MNTRFLAIFLLCFFIGYNGIGIVGAESPEIPLSSSTISIITDDEINGFLFRVSSEVADKVKTLGAEAIENLPVPILFEVSVGDFTDTWQEARAGGRVHLGTDIIAPLGGLIVSPTDAVVTKIGYDSRGGNFVITANPGGEQFYFAHLDAPAENLSVGDSLKAGEVIGYVGNTGNARGKSPHLHFEIYYKGENINPFPRLNREFSADEKTTALNQILTANKIILGADNAGVRFLQRFLINSNAGPHAKALAKTAATGFFGPLTKNAFIEYQKTAGISPASGNFGPITKTNILTALNPNIVLTEQTAETEETEISYSLVLKISKDLEINSRGDEVAWLQEFLINADTGVHARKLSDAGATGQFGILTKNALAEYQKAMGINPALGYFGAITRASLKTLGGN